MHGDCWPEQNMELPLAEQKTVIRTEWEGRTGAGSHHVGDVCETAGDSRIYRSEVRGAGPSFRSEFGSRQQRDGTDPQPAIHNPDSHEALKTKSFIEVWVKIIQ